MKFDKVVARPTLLYGSETWVTMTRDMTGLEAAEMRFLRSVSPLNPELNPICYLLALLGAHHFLHVSRIRVKSLTFRLLMS